MDTCKTCGQKLTASSELASARPNQVEIKAIDKFAMLCDTLSKMDSLKGEPKMVDFLNDVPSKLRRYGGNLTEGQAKFFKVIHKTATGAWPNLEDFQKEDAPVPGQKLPDDDFALPF